MQSRKHSFIESCMNVFSGMVIAFIISYSGHIFAPWIQKHIWSGFQWEVSMSSNAVMTIVLTIVSVIRSYAWRRHFNKKI